MKVGVIYDFGVNKGGGDYVMLNILQALHEAGHQVSLMTSNPLGLKEITNFFGKNILNIYIKRITLFRFIGHPYSIYMIARKAKKMLENFDLVIVSDDVPKPLLNARKILVYVHYPHAARLIYNELKRSAFKETIRGKLLWSLHKLLFPRFFFANRLPENCLVLVNSSLTKNHAERVYLCDTTLLYPPVEACKIYEYFKMKNPKKRSMAVVVGRLEPERQVEIVLEAAKLIKNKYGIEALPHIVVAGFAKDSKYIKKILSLICDHNLEPYIRLYINISRSELIKYLLSAKMIISPHPHEQFGISVVEGMAARCIPVVRKGFNGPWMDITQQGKYGIGFSKADELAEILYRIDAVYDSFDVQQIADRSLKFDEEIFRKSFLDVASKFVTAEEDQ
jgi:glycosyltransferase involved in cell wall biosynthesis